jgi:hypothetical protein
MDTLFNYAHIYFSRPTVVVADIVILTLGIICVAGVMTLRRKVNDLAISIRILADRIAREKS